MTIPTKDFNKLKQLDRIEYLLRKDRIEKNNEFSMISIYWIVGILFAVISLSLSWYSAFNTYPPFLRTFPVLGYALLWIYLIDLAIAIFKQLQKKKELKELYDEFFEVKSKK